MKLDTYRLAIALGGATAILWIACSALVALFSGTMMTMTGHMLHMNMASLDWQLTFSGFLLGLIVWTVCAAIAGALVGWIYNAAGRSGAASGN